MTAPLRSRAEAGHALLWSGLAVSAAYVGSVVMANWASTHWAALLIGSLIVPAGTVWAGMTLTLRDLLHETLGASGVVAAIVVGAWLSWSLASPQIAVASVVAFAMSEGVDSIIYGRARSSARTSPDW
jgi:uncharacterized PurR-regulated membrane protein YhhQ (DUF165 family)